MKNLTLNSIYSKYFGLILFLVFNAHSNINAQNAIKADKSSTVVHASSLREMFVSETDDETFVFEIAIAGYFNVRLNYVTTDPELKNKLIKGILEDLSKNGYELPKKQKNKDYFEPYKFILDLPVYFNKTGYMIALDKIGEGQTTSIDKNLRSSLNK